MQKLIGSRFYYGWVIVGITCLTLIVAAGLGSSRSVFLVAIEGELGWSRATLAFAVSIGLLLYGLVGPLAGRLIDRFGPKLVMMAGMGLAGVSMFVSATMTEQWQLNVFWGLLSGIGTGLAAAVLGATVASRWFVARRGLVLGIFGGATSAGQLIFVPLLMTSLLAIGWRQSTLILGVIALAILIPIAFLMKDDPAQIGLEPYGGRPLQPAAATMGGVMLRALRTPEFWLLAGSFFVCGATSAGIVGTHFIPHSLDHGIAEATAAGALALMGAMNFIGTVGSGWLTDRVDPRKLLAIYYTFRGVSLLALPFITHEWGLVFFAILFGLDYIATVPPTVTLVATTFGRHNVGSVFGWVFFSHQVGAASLAFAGGWMRVTFGDYQFAFIAAGLLAMIGAGLAMLVNRRTPAPTPAVAA